MEDRGQPRLCIFALDPLMVFESGPCVLVASCASGESPFPVSLLTEALGLQLCTHLDFTSCRG